MTTTTRRTLATMLAATALLGGCAMTPEQEAGMLAALGAMSYTVSVQQEQQRRQQAYYQSMQPRYYTIRPTYGPGMPGYYTIQAR